MVIKWLEQDGRWLYIGGATGSGKTHLSVAAMLKLLKRGKEVYYMLWREEVPKLKSLVNEHEEYEFLRGKHFVQSDVVTTMITCADGTLITLKLDTTLPRAYSREFTVSGTRGMYSELENVALEDGNFMHESHIHKFRDSANNYKDMRPKIWQEITEEEIKAGHGGMDTLLFRAFFDAVRNGDEMPIDVYDAASWMVISCLTEASIANGGMPIDIPDFTSGHWIMREPKDVTDLA
jgi:hypothetical protein